MTDTGRILIVDDDAVFAETLARALGRRGYLVDLAESPQAALALTDSGEARDAVVLDLRLGTESGLGLIGPLRAAWPDVRILLLTGYASIATAVEAIKLGAVHYLPKPAGVEEILAALGRLAGNPDTPAPEIDAVLKPACSISRTL